MSSYPRFTLYKQHHSLSASRIVGRQAGGQLELVGSGGEQQSVSGPELERRVCDEALIELRARVEALAPRLEAALLGSPLELAPLLPDMREYRFASDGFDVAGSPHPRVEPPARVSFGAAGVEVEVGLASSPTHAAFAELLRQIDQASQLPDQPTGHLASVTRDAVRVSLAAPTFTAAGREHAESAASAIAEQAAALLVRRPELSSEPWSSGLPQAFYRHLPGHYATEQGAPQATPVGPVSLGLCFTSWDPWFRLELALSQAPDPASLSAPVAELKHAIRVALRS